MDGTGTGCRRHCQRVGRAALVVGATVRTLFWRDRQRQPEGFAPPRPGVDPMGVVGRNLGHRLSVGSDCAPEALSAFSKVLDVALAGRLLRPWREFGRLFLDIGPQRVLCHRRIQTSGRQCSDSPTTESPPA